MCDRSLKLLSCKTYISCEEAMVIQLPIENCDPYLMISFKVINLFIKSLKPEMLADKHNSI